MPRLRTLPLVVVALLLVVTTACLGPRQQTAFDLLNERRTRHGLLALASDGELNSKADPHSLAMAQAGHRFHSDLRAGIVSSPRRLGRTSPRPAASSGRSRCSSSRRGTSPTMIDGGYDAVGVGVADAPDGSVFVTLVIAER